MSEHTRQSEIDRKTKNIEVLNNAVKSVDISMEKVQAIAHAQAQGMGSRDNSVVLIQTERAEKKLKKLKKKLQAIPNVIEIPIIKASLTAFEGKRLEDKEDVQNMIAYLRKLRRRLINLISKEEKEDETNQELHLQRKSTVEKELAEAKSQTLKNTDIIGKAHTNIQVLERIISVRSGISKKRRECLKITWKSFGMRSICTRRWRSFF